MALAILMSTVAALVAAESPTAFDDPFVRTKIVAAVSASWSTPPTKCLHTAIPDAAMVREIFVKCDEKGDDCYGYVAMSPAEKAIIIGFRGTEGPSQFLAEIEQTALAKQAKFGPGGSVSKYFLHAFDTVWGGGLQDAVTVTSKLHPDYEIWVVGHSLGGSLACITAATISAAGIVPKEKIRLITMGQPRTGNKLFANAVDELVPFAYRVTHNKDIIPQVPPELFGYHHHSHEVFYPSTMDAGNAIYKVCGKQEDKKCSDGHLDLSVKDHVNYFAHDVSSWGKSNCGN